MGAIFYDEVGLAIKVGDVLQLKEGAASARPRLAASNREASGYTMDYTQMGKTGLFLYKGREGLIEKVDEINMEVGNSRAFLMHSRAFLMHSRAFLMHSCALLMHPCPADSSQQYRHRFPFAPISDAFCKCCCCQRAFCG
jgi:hypothetical protein